VRGLLRRILIRLLNLILEHGFALSEWIDPDPTDMDECWRVEARERLEEDSSFGAGI